MIVLTRVWQGPNNKTRAEKSDPQRKKQPPKYVLTGDLKTRPRSPIPDFVDTHFTLHSCLPFLCHDPSLNSNLGSQFLPKFRLSQASARQHHPRNLLPLVVSTPVTRCLPLCRPLFRLPHRLCQLLPSIYHTNNPAWVQQFVCSFTVQYPSDSAPLFSGCLGILSPTPEERPPAPR